MTVPAPCFSRNGDLIVRAGAAIAPIIVLNDANGTPIDITGREFFYSIFEADDTEVLTRSTVASGTSVALPVLDGDTTRDLRDNYRPFRLRILIGFYVEGGYTELSEGMMRIESGPRTLVSEVTDGDPEEVTLTVDETSARLVVSMRGSPGLPNTLTIGTVTTGAPGVVAEATLAGAAPDQVLNLTIPRGITGETPDLQVTVQTGAPGSSASVVMGGTPEAPTALITVPRGDAGVTPSFSVGTVTTGAAGSSAAVTVTGTSAAPILNLTIPIGTSGRDGASGDSITMADAFLTQRFALLNLGTQTAVNLTDASAVTATKSALASGLQINMTTTSRTFAFSTTDRLGANRTQIKYAADCTFASVCYCGISIYDGVNRAYLYYQNNGRLSWVNSRDASNVVLSTALPVLTTGQTVAMELVYDAVAETLNAKVTVGSAAPFVCKFSNVSTGSIELIQRGASTVTHRYDIAGLSAYDQTSYRARVDQQAISAADAASMAYVEQRAIAKGEVRLPPSWFPAVIPTSYRFYQDGGKYWTNIAVKPILSEYDPEVLTLYVDMATGSDANPGTSTSPLKGLKAAAARALAGSKLIIKAKGGLYPYDYAFGATFVGAALQVVSWDGLPIVSSRHDTTLAWALDSGTTYSTTFTNGIAGVFDFLNLANTYATNLTLAASLAACRATPGTYFISATTLYINAIDGRAPDANMRVYKKATSGTGDDYGLRLATAGQSVYLENVQFEGGVAPFTTASTGIITGYFKNVSYKYAVGANGFNWASGGLAVSIDCLAAMNSQDGYNYKFAAGPGAVPLGIEIRCIGEWNGFDGQGTNNNSTCHGTYIIRVNGRYQNAQNRSIHDIISSALPSLSWNMGCASNLSRGGYSNWQCGLPATNTDTSKMRLDGCSSTVTGAGHDIETGGTSNLVEIYNFTGTGTNTGGGTITTVTP